MSKSPFPGMNPYLEHPHLWSEVHNSLIIAMGNAITQYVAPNYYVAVESRVYEIVIANSMLAEHSPIFVENDNVQIVDVTLPRWDEINHCYLEIRTVQGHERITVIELLSPANKIDADGREDYLYKRLDITSSSVNLIEIDLLRAGQPLPLIRNSIKSDYTILVSRSWTKNSAKLYAFNLKAPIPDFPIPLQQGDNEPIVNLNQILHDLYGRARFDLRIDYTQPPIPPLTEKQAEWASQLLSS